MTGRFDVQHRDVFDSLAAARDAGGADIVLTSPPYPDALRLSADDVGTLAADNAIETCAMAFATGQDGTR